MAKDLPMQILQRVQRGPTDLAKFHKQSPVISIAIQAIPKVLATQILQQVHSNLAHLPTDSCFVKFHYSVTNLYHYLPNFHGRNPAI